MADVEWDKADFIGAMDTVTKADDWTMKTNATRTEKVENWERFAQKMQALAPEGFDCMSEDGQKALSIRCGAINREIAKVDAGSVFRVAERPPKQVSPKKTVIQIMKEKGLL